MKFRNVNAGRRNYQLESDSFKGLKSAIDTNRPLLALEYVAAILTELQEDVSALKGTPVEQEVVAVEEEQAETSKSVRTPKKPASKEDVS